MLRRSARVVAGARDANRPLGHRSYGLPASAVALAASFPFAVFYRESRCVIRPRLLSDCSRPDSGLAGVTGIVFQPANALRSDTVSRFDVCGISNLRQPGYVL